jgi:hypothetical protein
MELNLKRRSLDAEWSQFVSSQYENAAVSLRIKKTPTIQDRKVGVGVADDRSKPTHVADQKRDEEVSATHNGYGGNTLQEEIHDDSSSSDDDTVYEVRTYDTFVPNVVTPKCDDLYISTKTKVLFLNQEIDISRIFWGIPIIRILEAPNRRY